MKAAAVAASSSSSSLDEGAKEVVVGKLLLSRPFGESRLTSLHLAAEGGHRYGIKCGMSSVVRLFGSLL